MLLPLSFRVQSQNQIDCTVQYTLKISADQIDVRMVHQVFNDPWIMFLEWLSSGLQRKREKRELNREKQRWDSKSIKEATTFLCFFYQYNGLLLQFQFQVEKPYKTFCSNQIMTYCINVDQSFNHMLFVSESEFRFTTMIISIHTFQKHDI